jgi:hypothetical protein
MSTALARSVVWVEAPVRHAAGNDAVDDIAAEVNREDATLERGHHGRGRLVIIRALFSLTLIGRGRERPNGADRREEPVADRDRERRKGADKRALPLGVYRPSGHSSESRGLWHALEKNGSVYDR